jgi:hypothetical protein
MNEMRPGTTEFALEDFAMTVALRASTEALGDDDRLTWHSPYFECSLQLPS